MRFTGRMGQPIGRRPSTQAITTEELTETSPPLAVLEKSAAPRRIDG
jgi:hypothetical protein